MTIAAATAENGTRAFIRDDQALPVGAGFSTRDEVRVAASWLGLTELARGTAGANVMLERESRYRIAVSPGSVQLRVIEQPTGWEDHEGPYRRPWQGRDWERVWSDHAGRVVWRPLSHDRSVHGDQVGWIAQQLDQLLEDQGVVGSDVQEDGELEQLPPAPCRWWSARSRSRMVRALSQIDWRPVIELGGCRPAMVTLTYPGDWLSVAPTARTVKRHLSLFRRRLVRLYETNNLGRPGGVWKLEFQRRGAPHLHLYMPVPVAPVRWGDLQVRFQTWLSETWAEIVGAEGDELLRHRQAGTGVDFAEGARASDPRRLAVYFTRHNAKGSRSKQYQHRVPDEWETAGRWWGTFGVSRIVVEAECSSSDLLLVRRTLRAWTRSQQVKGRPRAVPQQVPRGITSSGVQRRRWVKRRYRIKSLSGKLGGFVVVNDGPQMAAMLARVLRPEPPPRVLP